MEKLEKRKKRSAVLALFTALLLGTATLYGAYTLPSQVSKKTTSSFGECRNSTRHFTGREEVALLRPHLAPQRVSCFEERPLMGGRIWFVRAAQRRALISGRCGCRSLPLRAGQSTARRPACGRSRITGMHLSSA